jgi:hypothetical protein
LAFLFLTNFLRCRPVLIPGALEYDKSRTRKFLGEMVQQKLQRRAEGVLAAQGQKHPELIQMIVTMGHPRTAGREVVAETDLVLGDFAQGVIQVREGVGSPHFGKHVKLPTKRLLPAGV